MKKSILHVAISIGSGTLLNNFLEVCMFFKHLEIARMLTAITHQVVAF